MDNNSSKIQVNKSKQNEYTFVMPAGTATVQGTFVKYTNPFADVKDTDYFYDPVEWAVINGITNGTSDTTFSPDMIVTRSQTVTFLWHFLGK